MFFPDGIKDEHFVVADIVFCGPGGIDSAELDDGPVHIIELF